jgi:hypothetical protein
MKFDVKEAPAIPKVLALVSRYHVPQQRLLWNLTVLDGADDGIANASMATLQLVRRMYPESYINLSFPVPYSPERLAKVAQIAQQVGGPIMFPLQAEYVTPQIVAALRPYGRVAIWNSPRTYDPSDVALAAEQFRAMGCNGMIDIRSEHLNRRQRAEAVVSHWIETIDARAHLSNDV